MAGGDRQNAVLKRKWPAASHDFKLDARIVPERIEIVPTVDIKPNARNAKKHPEQQIALLQENFENFGFTTPLLVDEDYVIRRVAGDREGGGF